MWTELWTSSCRKWTFPTLTATGWRHRQWIFTQLTYILISANLTQISYRLQLWVRVLKLLPPCTSVMYRYRETAFRTDEKYSHILIWWDLVASLMIMYRKIIKIMYFQTNFWFKMHKTKLWQGQNQVGLNKHPTLTMLLPDCFTKHFVTDCWPWHAFHHQPHLQLCVDMPQNHMWK